MRRPLIGITVDNKDNSDASTRYESPIGYARAVTDAGGLPMLLPQEPSLADEFVERCDGVLLTGGGDPRMEPFGGKTHHQAKLMAERRQAFEVALLTAINRRAELPTLGVCLGMQMMALCAGGDLNQHLPDTLGDEAALRHQKDNRHTITLHVRDSVLGEAADAPVPSWHHQAVANIGRLRMVASSPDGVIEAIDDPARPFYLGVQWHPERGGEGSLNRGLLARFVMACRRK